MAKFERSGWSIAPPRANWRHSGWQHRCDRHAPKVLDIDEAAIILIREFGDDSPIVAYSRICCCLSRGDEAAAAHWNKVAQRIVAWLYPPREGPLH